MSTKNYNILIYFNVILKIKIIKFFFKNIIYNNNNNNNNNNK